MTFPVLLFQIQGYLPSPRRVYNSVKNITRRTNYYEIVACFGNFLYLCATNLQDMEKVVFKLLLSKEAHDFINSQTKEVKGKIGHNIRRIQKGERNVELFKKLDGSDIWEFRTIYRKTSYRLFSFWDTEEETLVVATHGIVKKTQKTPAKDIAKAEDFRKQYFENKKKQV